MDVQVFKVGAIEYLLRGSHPTLLILSGLHGDEHEVIDAVSDYVRTQSYSLPDFLFIPQVSPSAVLQKTRRNQYGHDINRQFFVHAKDSEVQNIKEVINRHQFNLCLEFHEDHDRTLGFYVYDSGLLTNSQLAAYRALVHTTGARFYTGIDDPFDAHLGFHVERGYVSTPLVKLPPEAGFLMQWLLTYQKTKRVFSPEIPGKAPLALKQALVATVFDFILQLEHLSSYENH